MKAPKLKASREFGEGRVEFPDDWLEHSAILRADILKDWIWELEKQYNRAVFDMTTRDDAEGGDLPWGP
jgi:hypothetical protein